MPIEFLNIITNITIVSAAIGLVCFCIVLFIHTCYLSKKELELKMDYSAAVYHK